jgi:hypothetical protein
MNKKVISISFVLLLFSVSIINILMPQQSFSENENRYLQTFPDLNSEDIFSGKFSEYFASYSSDQFMGRNAWISLKTISELTLLKKDNGRVYFGSNGTLFDATEKIDNKQLNKNIGYISDYISFLQSHLTKLNASVLLVPTSTEILSDHLPLFAPVADQQSVINKVSKELNGTAVVYDSTTLLKSCKGNYLYYRTDHHWTTNAAYLVYTGWAEEIGLTPLTKDNFSINQVSSAFYGTLHSKANLTTIKPDTVNVYNFTDHIPIKAEYGEDDVRDTIYFDEFVDKKDVYSYFLGGNKPLVDITTGTKNGKTIMVIKDSFANCFVPFLINHFERILVVDPRHLNTDYADFALQNNITDLLVLYNVPNFTIDKNISRLSAYKK